MQGAGSEAFPNLGPTYTVLEEVGRGAEGTVYKVLYTGEGVGDLAQNSSVAVKVIHGSKIRPDEVLLQASLKHVNIIRLFDVFRCRAGLAVVMELADHQAFGLPGPTLWHCMEKSVATNTAIRVYGTICEGALDAQGRPQAFQLPIRGGEAMIRWVFVQVACGLDYLHRHPRRLCNRDVKPQNVMVCGFKPHIDNVMRPLVKLADFGFVRATDASQASTRLGTPNYAPPEVLTLPPGRSYDGTKADVWSAGCLLYVLATGLEPFRERGDPALWGNAAQYARIMVDRIADRRGRALARLWDRERVEHCSPELVALLRAMLEPDPDRRMSMHEVLAHEWLQRMDSDMACTNPETGREAHMPLHRIALQQNDLAAEAAAAAHAAALNDASSRPHGWNFPHLSLADVRHIIDDAIAASRCQDTTTEADTNPAVG